MLTINFEKLQLYDIVRQAWGHYYHSVDGNPNTSFTHWVERYLIDQFNEIRSIKLYVSFAGHDKGNWCIDVTFASPEAELAWALKHG